MGIKLVPSSQGALIVTDEERDFSDRPLSRPEIRSYDADDAVDFEENPLAAYKIREWRHSDAKTEHEQADLFEFHCLTIVFRSGWRVRVLAFFRDYSNRYPVDFAFLIAEELMADRDPRIGPHLDLPMAIIPFEVRLMGSPLGEALEIAVERFPHLLTPDGRPHARYALATA